MDVAALRTAIRGLRLGQRLRTATDVRDQTPRPESSTRSPAGRARPAPGSAPSPGSPAWSDGASAATTSSHRPRIVLAPSRKVSASFPQRSHHVHAARRTPLCPPTRRPPVSWGCHAPAETKPARPRSGERAVRRSGNRPAHAAPPPPPSPAQGARVRSQGHPGLGQKTGGPSALPTPDHARPSSPRSSFRISVPPKPRSDKRRPYRPTEGMTPGAGPGRLIRTSAARWRGSGAPRRG
jgi:hypothetical protein